MFARYDDTLNLSCSFIDLVDFRVSHQFLDRVLTVETVATKDLHKKTILPADRRKIFLTVFTWTASVAHLLATSPAKALAMEA